MKTMLIATNNQHKVEEFQQMLKPYGYEVKSLKDVGLDIDVEETGTTFQENAVIKAKACYEHLKMPVLADDSGFSINALHGEPGIYSARYLGKDTSYEIKCQHIIKQCEDASDRGCTYTCAIAYIDELGKEHIFTGVLQGEVAKKMEGTHGFGYDPIFYYEPFQTTLANVSDEEKNAISHRRKALEQVLAYIKEA